MFTILLSLLQSPLMAADDLDAIWQAELHRLPTSALVPYVGHEDPMIRARAALALGRLRDGAALVELRALAADDDPEVRLAAAFALGLTPNGVVAIRGRLALEEEPQIRARLLASLGLQGEQRDVDALLDGLGEGGEQFREAAVGLGRMAIREVSGVDAADVLIGLARQLEAPPWVDLELRQAAAFALARIGPDEPPAEVEAILWERAAGDRDPTIRALSVRALRDCAGDRSGELIELALADPEEDVRLAGARSLISLSAAAPGALERALEDPDRAVRLEAIAVAGALATPPEAGDEDAVDEETDDAEDRPGGAPDLPALLAGALESDDAETVAAALRALASAGALDETRRWLQPEQPLLVREAAIAGVQIPSQLSRLATGSAEAAIRTAAASRLVALAPTAETASALMDADDALIAAIGMGALLEDPDKAQLDDVVGWMQKSAEPDIWREGLAAIGALLDARARSTEALEAIVAEALANEQITIRRAAMPVAERLGLEVPAQSVPGELPVSREEILRVRSARILTDVGEIRVELYPEIAPMTVWNFAKLAEEDFFDGLKFHRVVPDFVIQDGCPRGDGWGGPGYAIPDELSWIPYTAGALGMASAGPDTAGSQWFITLSPQPHLEASYTLFGQISLKTGAPQRVQRGTSILDVIIERVP